MADRKAETKGPKNPARELEKSLNFIEELSWLMRSYQGIDTRTLNQLRNQLAHMPMSREPELERFRPENPNIFFLVGTLPSLFMDEAIFPSNEDIAEFAELALGIEIARWAKKSKFEIIGHIVCTATSLKDSQINGVVKALGRLVSKESTAHNLVKDRKKQGLSWNVLIQELNGG